MTTPPARMIIDADTELRPLTEKDASALFRLVDQNRAYLREWLPWVDFTRTEADERTFLRAQYQDTKGLNFGIWYQNRVTGTIGYHPIDWQTRKVEIGYWLGAQFQGQGLMTSACRMLITLAFDNLRLNKVEIRCATGNMRSRAIPLRLGFTQEGIIRQGEWLYDHYVDLVLYGLLVNEWQLR